MSIREIRGQKICCKNNTFLVENKNILKSAISRQAKANKFSLVFWLNEIVLKSAISRQAKANKFSLVFWNYVLSNKKSGINSIE